ncbi:MAG TPA: lactate dehydrogenase [Chloroflexi bacterium]|nr:lactate dehydrogenase [Chloroflexota bacterium]
MHDDYFVTVDHKGLLDFLTEVYQRVGLSAGNAALVADSLVTPSLQGNPSHGVLLAYGYFRRLQAGNPDPKAVPEVISDSGATAVIDGKNAMGQMVSALAMRLAIDKARDYGVGIVGARATNHFGATGYWSSMALKSDMIGIAMTNTSPLMAPWGGTTPVLGSSPVSVAIPAGREAPVLLDMATTMVAGGKLRVAQMRGEKIPIGWAVGADNQLTDDPAAALKGHILPLGGVCGYKGYGLALVVDILSAVLMGAGFGTAIKLDSKDPRNLGHYFQAIDVSRLMPVDEFKARVDALLQELKSSELEPGVERVYYAGEMEAVFAEEQRRNGLRLDGPVYKDLEKIGAEVGVPVTFRRA